MGEQWMPLKNCKSGEILLTAKLQSNDNEKSMIQIMEQNDIEKDDGTTFLRETNEKIIISEEVQIKENENIQSERDFEYEKDKENAFTMESQFEGDEGIPLPNKECNIKEDIDADTLTISEKKDEIIGLKVLIEGEDNIDSQRKEEDEIQVIHFEDSEKNDNDEDLKLFSTTNEISDLTQPIIERIDTSESHKKDEIQDIKVKENVDKRDEIADKTEIINQRENSSGSQRKENDEVLPLDETRNVFEKNVG